MFLFEKFGWKLIKNHFYEDFETKKLLEKFSESVFLIRLKIHQKMQKVFQNIFSSLLLSFSKLKFSSNEKSSFIFFVAILKFSDRGIIDPTENV